MVVLWVHHQKFFSSEKNQNMFGWRECLSLFKSFAIQSFFFSFITCDKNWLFFSLLVYHYEKYQMSSCTTCLIRNSNTPVFLAMDLNDLLGSLSIMIKISPRNLRVLFLEWSEWGFWLAIPLWSPLNWSNFLKIFCTVLRSTRKCSEIFILEFLVLMLTCTASHFQISGGVDCIIALLSSLTVPNWL